MPDTIKQAFAIFFDTLCQGTIPARYDESNFPITYATEREAQLEIADLAMERLQQLIAGERDFDDAIAIDDFVLPVYVWPDGTIQTEDGHRFGVRET
jgi:hypothetical protein